MNIAFTFKNFEPSDHLKKYAEKRFQKLSRFAPKTDNIELNVALSVDKFRHKIEVQLSGDDLSISAVEQSHDMYASVDMVLDKLEAQLKKHSEKKKDKRKGTGKSPVYSVYSYEIEDNRSKNRVGSETFEPKPMHVEEAIDRLDVVEEEFLVFVNSETEVVNVVYQKKDGSYGVIIPGF